MRLAVWLFLCGCSSSTNNAATLRNQGFVGIDSQKFQSGGTTYGQGSVTAGFFHEGLDPYLGCAKKSFGSCTVRFDCKPILTSPPDDLGIQPYASAGKITVTGLSGVTTLPVELTVMDMGMFAGQYTTLQQYTPIFAGGDGLTVTAAGGEVPAFSSQLTAPSSPTLTSPSGNSQIPVSRSQDLPFAWSGGGSGQLRLQIQVMPAMGSPSGLDCSWPVGDGSGTIPAAALQMMPKGNGQGTLTVLSLSLKHN
jgi:hypothetical protein